MNDRDLLPHLPAIAAVAHRRSFKAAAADLGMGASAVSHAVRIVEARLGTALFARTTRSVAPTEAGEAFIAAIGPALDTIGEAVDEAIARRGRVAGTLRINAPRLALVMGLTEVVLALAREHPGLTVEVVTDEALTDIIGGGFDAGVRLGEMIAQDMVAVRLTPPFRTAVVASPDYLDTRGRPERIGDLSRHACIGFREISGGRLYAWEFEEEGRDVAIEVTGPAAVTDPLYALELAEAGVGIAYLYEPIVNGAVEAGRLEEVLADFAIEEPGLFVYFPRGAATSPKMRTFLDTVRARRSGR